MGLGNLFGLFGHRKQPQYGGDVDNLEANFDASMGQPKKPGFGDPGGLGEKLRMLGAMMRDDPSHFQGLQELQQRQAILHAQAQQAEAKRRSDWEDWVAQQEWKRDNPEPVNNDTINDFNWFKGLSPEDRAIYQEMRPEYRQGPDGRFYRVDTAGQMPAQSPPAFTEDDWNAGQPVGGPAPAAGQRPFSYAPPQRLRYGGMTSGRRTEEGNKIVGGVPGSQHLTGRAADWDGADLAALLAEVRKLPNLRRAFIHKGHVHGEGDWNVPYFGKRGTAGLRKK